jgi:hypothetical protein
VVIYRIADLCQFRIIRPRNRGIGIQKVAKGNLMDDNNKCRNCLYWRRKGSTMSGKCHRHAPKRIPSKDSGYVNDRAVTNEEDFCGDFNPRYSKNRQSWKTWSSSYKRDTYTKSVAIISRRQAKATLGFNRLADVSKSYIFWLSKVYAPAQLPC